MHRFLAQHELLQPAALTAAELAGQRQRRRAGWSQWLLHNYLFFRVPLLRPDRWLTRWTPRLAFLYGPAFRWLTQAALLAGMWGVSRSWDAFTATLVDMLSWEGLAAYGLTLAAVKTLHEFGHGVTAKRYGCRVPTMGVAFLVLWPVAYTDTNEVWKLTRRDQRLKVAAAGIATELTIAVWAMLAWVWLPDGPLRAMAFLLATTTWVSTVLINASPFMRFDGYFLLSDFLQMPNLHARAFALARWDLRERLFALGEPAPEHFPPRGARTDPVRLGHLDLPPGPVPGHRGPGLSLLHQGPGHLSFLVEIVWFIARPLWSEIGAWRQRGAAIGGSRRARWSALLLILIVLGAFAPWPVPVRGSGLLQAREQWPLHAPEASRLASPRRPRGTRCRPMRTLSCWTRLRWPPAPRKARRARCNWRGSPPPPASIPNCDATGRCCASARPRRRRSRSRWTAKRRATAWKRQAPAGCATVIRTCARATGWAAASCWDAS